MSILRLRRFLPLLTFVLLSGCATGGAPVEAPSPAEIPALEDRVEASPSDVEAAVRLGAAYREAGRLEDARRVLDVAVERRPGHGPAHLLLGLVYEDLERFGEARRVYEAYLERGGADPIRSTVRDRMALVRRGELAAAIDSIVAREQELAVRTPDPTTVAVFPFLYRGSDTTYAPLSRALAAFLSTDLSQTGQLTVLERARVQTLLDELEMAESEYVDPRSAARSGRMLGARTLVQGLLEGEGNRLQVESSTVDASAPGEEPFSLLSDEETVDRIFEVEARIALAVYERLGIELTPAQRDRVTRRPTGSLEAFLAFGRGLMAEDDGRFDAAAEHYERAAQLDPDFQEAGVRQAEVESISAAAEMSTDVASRVALGDLSEPTAPTGGEVESIFDAYRAVEEVWLLTPTPLVRDAVTEVLGVDGLTFRPGQFRILIEQPGGTP
jgi:tetratricopeptide (TPR) repeat protein